VRVQRQSYTLERLAAMAIRASWTQSKPADRPTARVRDGFGSDTHGYEFRCHYLPHFISNSDTNTNIIEYEYKTNILNSDSHSNTYSIYNTES
jgi:hypothetical protein